MVSYIPQGFVADLPSSQPYTGPLETATGGVLGGALGGASTAQSAGGVLSGAIQGANMPQSGSTFSTYSGSELDAALKAAAPYGQGAMDKVVAAYNAGIGGAGMPGNPASQWQQGVDAWNSNLANWQPSGGLSGGGSGGGSAGGGGGAGGGSSGGGGLNLQDTGVSPTGSSPYNLQQSSTQLGNTVGYVNPGNVNQTGTVGYNGGEMNNYLGQNGALQPANTQAGLDAYKNTTGYQLLNAPGAYQQSPGYQYAMNEALNQVQNNAAAKGMLESGAVLKSMQQTASGLAQQDYGNWWNRQNQLYGDYQNRLQGLAGGPTGSADAMTTGANLAQGNLQTGSNLGSLFGNQGTAGMGGILNTAAAQSGNMINAGQQQAQVNAANQSTQLAGATLGSRQGGLF